MFARKAARTLALALALVALIVTAASAPAADNATAAPAAAIVKKTVNVNQASIDELARLPRVGPSLAGKIVSHREKNGPFKRAEDLMEVAGIGEKMFSLLKPYVSVSGPTTLTEKLSSKRDRRQGGAQGEGEARRPRRGEGRQVGRRVGREGDLRPAPALRPHPDDR